MFHGLNVKVTKLHFKEKTRENKIIKEIKYRKEKKEITYTGRI